MKTESGAVTAIPNISESRIFGIPEAELPTAPPDEPEAEIIPTVLSVIGMHLDEAVLYCWTEFLSSISTLNLQNHTIQRILIHSHCY